MQAIEQLGTCVEITRYLGLISVQIGDLRQT